jgi:hypothetical protein
MVGGIVREALTARQFVPSGPFETSNDEREFDRAGIAARTYGSKSGNCLPRQFRILTMPAARCEIRIR